MELEPLEMEVLLAMKPTAADLASLLVRCEGCGGVLPMTEAAPIAFQGQRFRFTGWTCARRWCAETAGAGLTLTRLPIDGGPWRVMSATVRPPAAAGPAKPTP